MTDILYRHLPPRPALLRTAAPAPDAYDVGDVTAPCAAARPAERPAEACVSHANPVGTTGGVGGRRVGSAAQKLLEAVDWLDTYRPACPVCWAPISGLLSAAREN